MSEYIHVMISNEKRRLARKGVDTSKFELNARNQMRPASSPGNKTLEFTCGFPSDTPEEGRKDVPVKRELFRDHFDGILPLIFWGSGKCPSNQMGCFSLIKTFQRSLSTFIPQT